MKKYGLWLDDKTGEFMRKLFLMVAALAILLNTSCTTFPSLKITDPKDPGFDITQFEFEDYRDLGRFKTTMEIMFPVGTSREYIEKVLVTYGGALHSPFRQITRYDYPYRSGLWNCRQIVVAYYDQNDLLEQKIATNMGCDGL